MENSLKDLLIQGAEQIDPQLNNERTIGILAKLFDEITMFNPVYKLVAAEGRELVIKHLLDCLAPYPIMKRYVKPETVFADLGSGSGLPGIVLASVFDNKFKLVERMGRRAGFLRSTIALTGLGGRVEVVEKDLSEVNEKFDIVTFRAFRQMKDIEPDLERIVKTGSAVMIYKSQDENIAEDTSHINEDVFSYSVKNYQVPFLDAQRSLLILETKI